MKFPQSKVSGFQNKLSYAGGWHSPLTIPDSWVRAMAQGTITWSAIVDGMVRIRKLFRHVNVRRGLFDSSQLGRRSLYAEDPLAILGPR